MMAALYKLLRFVFILLNIFVFIFAKIVSNLRHNFLKFNTS